MGSLSLLQRLWLAGLCLQAGVIIAAAAAGARTGVVLGCVGVWTFAWLLVTEES